VIERLRILTALSALLLAGVPGAARAQTQTTPAEVIAEVRVHGNHLTQDDEIVALAGLVLGAPFEATTIADITRRLRDAKRFDDVDVLKRFASIADPSLIVVVIVVNEGPVRVRMPGVPGGQPEVVRRRGLRNLMYLPILDAEDGYGLTYGARLAYVGLAGERSRLSFPLTWGGLKQAGAEFQRVFERGPVSRVELGLAARRRTNPAFDEEDSRRLVWLRAERQAGPARVGGLVGWERVSFAGATDDLRTAGLDVTLDTRLDPVLPRNAVYARAGVDRIDYASGGDVLRTSLDGRVYVGLIGQSVLEVRAARQAFNRAVPPYLMLLMGGWSSLRGFEAGAFTGERMTTASAELFVPLNSVLTKGKVGVSGFVDVGRTELRSALQQKHDATGVGGSLWMAIASFRMSLSVARGTGASTRVNFGGGFVF
jgi:outer membrane protein assembly factor BamA